MLLYVCQGFDNDVLYSNSLNAVNVSWVAEHKPAAEFTCTAKFRYRQEDSGVTVKVLESGDVEVIFDEPIRAITPGQAVVFYDGDVCLGGGTIDEVFKKGEKLTYVG